jgi:hypothetical protein
MIGIGCSMRTIASTSQTVSSSSRGSSTWPRASRAIKRFRGRKCGADGQQDQPIASVPGWRPLRLIRLRAEPRLPSCQIQTRTRMRADWYRNIMARSPVAFETAGHRYETPSFRALAPEDNYGIVADYMRRLPATARLLLGSTKSKGTHRTDPPPPAGRAQSKRGKYHRSVAGGD